MRDWHADIRARLAALRLSPEREAEIADELVQHLEQMHARAIAIGHSDAAADRLVFAELDAQSLAAHLKDSAPRGSANPPTLGAAGSRGDSFMESIWYDVRVTARSLSRAPALTAAVMLTLALGIGAATAIFSVVYGVLLRPLPYTGANRIMAIYELTGDRNRSRLADANFRDFRDRNRTFRVMAKYASTVSSVAGASQPTRSVVTSAAPGFLDVFGVQPAAGRDFSSSESMKGAAPTALVSYGYWTQYLASSRDLARVHLKIDGTDYAVIGVLPPGFRYPGTTDIWTPAGLNGESDARTGHNFSAVGRLRDGVSVDQANADISAIARSIHDEATQKSDYLLNDGTVVPLQEAMTGRVRTTLLALLGAVGFLLLVACGNVANLLLTRASVKLREIAIRSALGAARWRLIRQFVTEAFLLTLAGGSLGVLGAVGGVRGLIALAPRNLPRLESIAVSIPALCFAIGLCVLIATGIGLFTATRATAGALSDALGEGGRGQAGSQRSQRVGRAIVAAQMAITLVLVVGAGLFGRSLKKALDVSPGFRIDSIVTMDIAIPPAQNAPARIDQTVFYARLLDQLKHMPGVRDVGVTSGLPMDAGLPDGQFLIMSPAEAPKDFSEFAPFLKQQERIGTADFGVATEGYFRTLGIPLIRGRLFDERDAPDAPHAAVINEALARKRWPNQDPIGRTIEFGNMDGDLRLLTIVGIVGDTHQYGLEAPPSPTVYVNLLQRPRSTVSVTLLTDADSRSISAAAQRVLHDLNPDVPAKFRTMSQLVSASLGSRRFNAILVGFFGVVALLLATVGVFGVMAYSVSRRTKEIGVRVALGATRGGVVRMIIGQGLRTTAIGVVIGLAGSLALTRTISAMLFGVTATDPVTFAGVTLLLVGAAVLACYVPARRAAKVDPTVALRSE